VKFLELSKDGGPESSVWAYWLFEIKSVASVALLRFDGASRDAYHSHAFDCVSWVLRGELREHRLLVNRRAVTLGTPHPFYGSISAEYTPSLAPVITRRDHLHRVDSVRKDGPTWVLTLRGPWADTWREWTRARGYETLTHGRKTVEA